MSTVAERLESQRKKNATKSEASQGKDALSRDVPLWNLLDFDKSSNIAWLIVLRLIQACTMTWNHAHPD